MKARVPPSLDRRVGGVETIHAAQARTHFFFQAPHETYDLIQARIRAMIASGEASENDQFVTFSWRRPAGEGG